ncbi:MAG: valine--tRNA ligase [Coriobacteriia bacterium]|jgi:valyl-tRNA synthetase|nr:valine--tRNA ligase [Coriobacteriia bacterium]
MPKAYDPKAVETPIFAAWLAGGYFEQQPLPEGERPFTVAIPPPNVTGSLHMGHALNNTIQDVVVRRARMTGRPTRWVLGTDHAGIATQNKVEQLLASQGLRRQDIGREAFVEKCWEWRAEHGSTIIGQLKAMGCSCDYSNEWFTMDPSYQEAVRRVFVDWYDRGLIYRGKRIINWCPRCSTALSDIEVEHEDLDSHLWHFRYPLKDPVGARDHVVVATTRPETMLGDTCVAVHPDDERYRDIVGATVVLPLIGREIPIVADDYVDPTFGTGAVKVTPAHDQNDFEIAERHGCEKINILQADATISPAGGRYAGLSRYEARRKVVADMEAAELLLGIDDHVHAVGHCYRCHTVVEPWLSDQWFVDMKPLAVPAIDAVRDGRVVFHPKRWENVYFHWMEGIRDWCISRQLWWGHRIPVYYCDSCDAKPVASMDDLTECSQCGGSMRQDEDVLDTWFSSQLWPFATLGWPKHTPELDYFYPTSVLSTARDILFLWVARMIMSGIDFVDGKVPFDDVIIHPTVFNAEGKRMSKSLGTGIDPLDLMEHYGADGMRFGLMLQATGSQDIRFAEEKLGSSRNFANKIWNASRFVLMNLDEHFVPGEPEVTTVADAWILSRLADLASQVDEHITTYQFGEAARALYDFFWNEFCDWYIELSKGRLFAGARDDATEAEQGARLASQRNLVFVLDIALRLLHPMMPFVTEEIWCRLPLSEWRRASSLMVAAWPDPAELARFRDEAAERSVSKMLEIVVAVRTVRARYKIAPRQGISVVVRTQAETDVQLLDAEFTYLNALGGIDSFVAATDAVKPAHSVTVVAGGMEVYVPLEGLIDFEAERTRVAKELAAASSDLAKVARKLANEGFLAKAAPEVIEKERSKEAELADRVAVLRGQLDELEA